MLRRLSVIIYVCLILLGCSKPVSHQEKQTDSERDVLSQSSVTAEPIPGKGQPEKTEEPAKTHEMAVENKAPCLKVSGPFCEVIESDGECDPKLIENHYKPGDELYWVNRTQYDTIECYYTEIEYNESHAPGECAELQNEGRGCIIDDSPDCNLMLDEDCRVTFTRASCDEKLMELGKNVGDSVPGIRFADQKKMECFYTEKERQQYANKHKLKCHHEEGAEHDIWECMNK